VCYRSSPPTWGRQSRHRPTSLHDLGPLFVGVPIVGVGPGAGIQLSAGNRFHPHRILFAASHGVYTFSVVWYSDDGGATFKLAKNASDPRKPAMLQLQVEPCLAETPSGGVLVSMRNEAYHRGYNTSNVTCNCRGVARSEDGGSTFGNPRPEPSLVGPVCEASMLSLPTAAGGRVIFHANPGHGTDRESKSPPDGRASGTVRRSFDGGRSWHGAVDINGDQAFSYSCMTELPQQDLVGLAYETVLPGSDTNWRASANNVVFTLVPKRLNGTAPLES
jgi:hypothetical protein